MENDMSTPKQKKAEGAILISDKADFRARKILRNKQGIT